MAINPVSLNETLRPWYLAGVRYLLLPEETIGQNVHHAATPLVDAPEKAFRGSRAELPRGDVQTSEKTSSHLPSQPSPKIPKPEPQTEKDWPEHWSRRLRLTPQAPVIWTYPELGDDLSGQGVKARSLCLKELLAAAGLPKGSSGFWPLRLPANPAPKSPTSPLPSPGLNDCSDDGYFFRAGLRLLSPQAVILIGAQSVPMTGMDIRLTTPFSQAVYEGMLMIVIPEFTALLQAKETFRKTSAYLRSGLGMLSLPGSGITR